jgi:HEAT repeat protein
VGRDLASLNGQLTAAEQVEVLRRLGQSCDSRAIAPLVARLGAASIEIREAAIDGLGRLGDLESAEVLLSLLEDPDLRIRRALIPALTAFPNPRIRNLVVNQLARGNPKEIDTAEKARLAGLAMVTLNQLVDTSYNTKAILFQLDLEAVGNPAVLPEVESSMRGLLLTRNGLRELIAILKKQSHPSSRSWAAKWLGRLQVSEARESLVQAAAKDPSPLVRAAAEMALLELDRPRP